MYVIKMEDDKSLVTTIKSTIYQGELNANTILFLLPNEWEEHLMADYGVRLDYITPDGIGNSTMMKAELESYKGYLQFYVPVGCQITDKTGEVELWLSILDMEGTVVIKTGSNYLFVEERKSILDYYPEEKRELLDVLTSDIETLKRTKADNVVFHKDSGMLQLTSEDVPIGDAVLINLNRAASINENGELVLELCDGVLKNLGRVVGKDGAVYVPHIDERKILTFTVENDPDEPPPPIDLNSADEWNGISDSEIKTDYTWEGI